MQWQEVFGLGLTAVGGLLSLTPRYISQPVGPPVYAGTWWFLGVPLVLGGVALFLWGRAVRSRFR